MPDDIVTMLRDWGRRVARILDDENTPSKMLHEAADEIERLRNDISTLEKEIAMVVPCHHKDGRRA